MLVVDLHTGHGEFGTCTLLSHVPEDHPDDAWLRRLFDATTWRTVTMELGTISDTRMIVNERAEHWVHFHGDRTNPEHARVVWDHRCGSTPDDADWESSARAHGVEVLDAARRVLSLGAS